MEQEELAAQNAPQESAPQELNKQEMLNNLKGEYEQNLKSFEVNFAKKAKEFTESNPELEELFFENKEEFFKKVLELQNDFVKTELTQKQDDISNLESEISLDNQLGEVERAKEAFLSAHPEIDINELLAFYAEELTPREQKAFESLPATELFNALYEIYMQKTQGQNPEQKANEELPKQVKGYPAELSAEASDDLPTQRY